MIALTVVAAAAASASVTPAPPEATDVHASPQVAQDIPASSIAVLPDATGPLANRWAWAERAARDARQQRYWVGYSISPVRTLPAIVYLDRLNNVFGDSMQFSGHLFSTVGKGLTFPGRRLVVPAPDGSLKILLALDTVRGATVVTAVHVSSISLPVDTKDLPVYWLGQADGSQSIATLGRFYDRASTQKLQSDVMAAIGVHDASNEIVAWLERRIASDDADDLRGDAAEWIAWHPIARSVTILDRTARGDRSVRVRQEAAEGLGDLALPEAAPVLIALARSRQDTATRMEAVEALGARSEPAALEALDAIARQDDVLDLRREAVETLGDLSGERGVPTLMQLARTHPEAEVRREAVETLGDAQPTAALVDLLKGFALGDQDLMVQTEAIETLADLPDAAGLSTLLELVQSHPRPNARREVVESLGDLATSQAEQPSADPQKIIDLLAQLAKSDRDVEVQTEATETLGDIGTPDAIARLKELARTHPDERIRSEAVESLGDTKSPDLSQLLKSIALEDKSPQVQHEAIETLEGLADGAGIEALLALAREHPDTRARKDALEALIESEQPRAREVVERFLKQAGR